MAGNFINSYGTLEQALQDWLARTDLADSNYLPEIIQGGENRLYQGFMDNRGTYFPGLRVREMEKAFAGGATISGTGTFAVPSDYLDLKYLIVTNSGGLTTRLERKPVEWVYQFYPDRTTDNVPQYVARDGVNFIFAPFPDAQYALSGIYFYRDTPLGNGYPDNWITASYPSLMLAACMAEAMSFIKDSEGQQFWEGRYQNMARSVQAAADGERLSGSPLAMAPG